MFITNMVVTTIVAFVTTATCLTRATERKHRTQDEQRSDITNIASLTSAML